MVEHGEAVYTLEELLAEYGDMIYRIAMHNMRHKADAEDIVQDIYIKLLHNMPSFQNAEMQKKWTFVLPSTLVMIAGVICVYVLLFP